MIDYKTRKEGSRTVFYYEEKGIEYGIIIETGEIIVRCGDSYSRLNISRIVLEEKQILDLTFNQLEQVVATININRNRDFPKIKREQIIKLGELENKIKLGEGRAA